MGKGSRARPPSVTPDVMEENWDRIFGPGRMKAALLRSQQEEKPTEQENECPQKNSDE